MFWIFLLITGVALVLFQLGALKVWVVVFQIALWAVSIVATLLGIGLIWKWMTSKKASNSALPIQILWEGSVMVAAAIPMAGAGLGLSAIAQAIKALYGMAVEINDFLDKHIEEMKGSDNPTISRTGRVLEMAKYGFGIGYISSVTIIAVGQLLLGNTLGAVTTVASAAVCPTLSPRHALLSEPSITVGGLCLMSEHLRVLEKLSKGLEIGIELIKALINFVIDKTENCSVPRTLKN